MSRRRNHNNSNNEPSFRFRGLVRGIVGVLSLRDRSRRRREDVLSEANRRFRHAVRDGAASVDAATLRARAREAFERRRRLPDEDIHILAVLEGVYLDAPGRAPRLRDGLVARLAKVGGAYYFLGRNGYYYKGSHRYGRGADLDFVVDTYVPLQIRLLAAPYRQLCRR
ncbi:hypothetical protein F5Y05DRAFT_420865 [Hypoxylon sp. FL0543]|nr:hypothetical protein F5Y05DRAFT_420865 [Hypoxylon sp. FL0543]